MTSKPDIICTRLHVQHRDHASKALLCKEIEIMDAENNTLKQYIQKFAMEKHLLLLELYRVNSWNRLFKHLSKKERTDYKLAIRQLRKNEKKTKKGE
jgi:hypothetical protein